VDSFVTVKRQGFTLVEIIIVAGILSIGLLMIARFFPLGLRAKESAEQYSTASLLGQQLLEEIKEKGYEALNRVYPSSTPHYGVKEGSFELHKGYTWRVEWWDTEISNLRKIRVRILYGEPKITGKEDSRPHLDLTTYLAKRD